VSIDQAAIIAFNKARLDEEEAAAKATAPPDRRSWRTDQQTSDDDETVIGWRVTTGRNSAFVAQAWGVGRWAGDRTADHIVRYDPARALRQVAAGRRILARHHEDEHEHGYCAGCPRGGIQGDLETEIDGCPELRDLASIWSDDPGYRQRWAS
jgi:hypothetical protein